MKVLIIFIIFILSPIFAYSWSDDETHPQISDIALNEFIFKAGGNLILNNIGIDEGIRETFTGSGESLTVGQWINKGAEREDAMSFSSFVGGNNRFNNHFHKAISAYPWGDAGLTNEIVSGASAPLWAQASLLQEQFPEGDRTWSRTRYDYLLALTASDETKRQEYFAKTFQGLGHQMHLLQDMAVPAHVRNDMHPIEGLFGKLRGFEKYFLESWVAKNVAGPIPSMPPIINLNVSHPIVPIARLFDLDAYNGGNPATELDIGLSEYTSANFFSSDTIFADALPPGDPRHAPFPRRESTNLQHYIDGGLLPETFIAPDRQEEVRFYIAKTGDGEQIPHFVRPGYFARELMQGDELLWAHTLTFYLDRLCHQDYAERLLPRAAGYSAALLDYFFRGRMEVGGVEVRDENRNITGMGIRLVNTTPEETMQNGSFWIAYRYSSGGNYVYGLSNEASMGNLLMRPEIDRRFFSATFSPAIPQDAGSPEYTLVYFGELGYEKGAVVAQKVDLGWNEEWNGAELRSENPWTFAGIDHSVVPESWGRQLTYLDNGRLVMENIRNPTSTYAQFNDAILRPAYLFPEKEATPYCLTSTPSWDECFPFDFGATLPVPVDKYSAVHFKIDEMSIDSPLPLAGCAAGYAEQGIIIRLDDGTALHLTVPGQETGGPLLYVTPGIEQAINLWNVIRLTGRQPPESANVVSIVLMQQLFPLCREVGTEHRQRLVVDFLRIE